MKEIDLLPEWYKSSKRREVSYRSQCIAFGGIFVVMMLWSFMMSHSISKATAELIDLETQQIETRRTSQEFAEIKSEVVELQKKADVLGGIDSRLDVASVLAEISFLVDKNVVLNKVDFSAERFSKKQAGLSQQSGNSVRSAGSNFSEAKSLLFGDVKFKILIAGVATDASGVTELVCKLEDSPYFQEVCPLFSRNKITQKRSGFSGGSGESRQVSEFEIRCYLANYKESMVN